MGAPRKIRRKYRTPIHPWNLTVLEEERELVKEYGLRNKKEIYKMRSLLRKFRSQAKKLTADRSQQALKEEKQLLDKLIKLNFLKPGSAIDAILDLTIHDIMNRRLQTIIYKHHLAKSIKQARQFIIHNHIFLGNKKLTVPSYIVSAEEESQIIFDPSSELSREDHPERIINKKEEPKDKIDKEIQKEEVQGLGELKDEEKKLLRKNKKEKEDWKKESEEIKEKESLPEEDKEILEETEKEIEKEVKEETSKSESQDKKEEKLSEDKKEESKENGEKKNV